MTSLLKDYFSDHLDRQVSKYFPPFSSRDFSHLVRELDEDEPRLEAIRSRLINVTEGLIKYLAYLSLAELCTSEKWQRLASGSVAGLIQSFITRRITGGTWRDIARDIMRNADRYGVETSCLPLRYLFSDDMLVDAISSLTTWRNASVHNRNPEVGPALNDLVTVLTGLSFLKDWYLVAVTHGVQWRLQGESARRFSGFTQAPSHDCLLLVGPVDHDEAGARPTLTLSPLMVAHINETTATIYGLEFSSRNQPILEEICGQQRIAEQALLAKIQEWSTKILSPAASAGQVFNFGSSTSIALAGREKELSVLRRRIQEARDEKRGEVIMLEGEFGVGKSRILGNLKEWLSDENIGYASIAFTHHSIDLPGRALRRLINYQKEKPVLSEDELQSFATAFDSHPASHLSDADVSERVENITDSLFHIADAEGGLAILIDDAHHADMVSARLIAHGAERMRSEPVPLVFLLGVQSEQLNSSRHLLQTVDRLIGFSGDVFLRMIISRLSEQEINNLCSNALHAQLSEDDSRFFREMSGGNPLYLVQLLRSAYFSRTLIQRTNNRVVYQ